MPGNFCQLCLVTAVLSTAGLMCVSSASAASGSSTTVVIDAGHGGHDRGGIPGQRIAEKEMTLDVSQRLKKILAGNGYRVVMTRENDVFVPLGTRAAIANSYRNAIFVSVHFNSAKRVGADGIETYFYGRDSLPLASAVHHFCRRRRAVTKSRSAAARLLYPAKSKGAVGPGGMRLPDQSERSGIHFEVFLSPKTRRRDCGRNPRALERQKFYKLNRSCKHSAPVVHRPN